MKSMSVISKAKFTFIAVAMAALLVVLCGCSGANLYQSMRKDTTDVEIPSEMTVYCGDTDKSYLADWYSNDVTKTMQEVIPLWSYVIDGDYCKYASMTDDYRTSDETTRSVKAGDIAVKEPVQLEFYTRDVELDYDVVVIGHIRDASTFVAEIPWKGQLSIRSTDPNDKSKFAEVMGES